MRTPTITDTSIAINSPEVSEIKEEEFLLRNLKRAKPMNDVINRGIKALKELLTLSKLLASSRVEYGGKISTLIVSLFGESNTPPEVRDCLCTGRI
jgi:hypothetical protein